MNSGGIVIVPSIQTVAAEYRWRRGINHEYAVPSRNVDAYRTFDFSVGNLPGCAKKMCSQRVRYTSSSWRSPENSAGGFTLGASVTILAGDGVRTGVTERCRSV